jgi:hypothetical protein
MASGSKDRNVFTEDRLGSGPSTMMKRSSMGKGDTDLVAFPQDNVHGVDLPNCMGGKMGGSVTNLSHSLEGASAVQRSKGKPESSGI